VTGLSIQPREVYAGSWAAEGTSTGGGGAFATAQLAAGQTDLYYRVRFKILSLTGPEAVNLLKFRQAAGTAIAELYVTASGLLGYRNNVLGVSNTSSIAVSAGVWHDAQMRVRVNDASSTVEVWLDGSRVAALSRTDSLGTNAVGRIQLGENLSNRTYDIVFDDVAVDTSRVTGS
jgi:hypothetical protein